MISTFPQLLFREANACLPPSAISRKRMSEDLLISILTATINRMRDAVGIRTTVILQQLHLAIIYVSIKFNFSNL